METQTILRPDQHQRLEQAARSIRFRAIQMVADAGASHIGSALSIVDILAVLYLEVLEHATDPTNPGRDRCILSKGHACSALYSVLREIGVLNDDQIATYGRSSSLLMSHASHHVPGVEFSTGSLGHGLPFGLGKALAAKMAGHSWRTFVVMSDGELDEGSNWEALMFAAHHKMSNLVAIVDCNGLQSLDTVERTLGLEPLTDKIAAFGCDVSEIDGHDYGALYQALSTPANRPLVVIARTTKGKGVSFMEDRVEWHYKTPSPEQVRLARQELLRA